MRKKNKIAACFMHILIKIKRWKCAYFYFYLIFFRRDVFSGVDEEELQRFLYDSDGCYNSSLFQSSSVSTYHYATLQSTQ
jgi:hypothetical protein